MPAWFPAQAFFFNPRGIGLYFLPHLPRLQCHTWLTPWQTKLVCAWDGEQCTLPRTNALFLWSNPIYLWKEWNALAHTHQCRLCVVAVHTWGGLSLWMRWDNEMEPNGRKNTISEKENINIQRIPHHLQNSRKLDSANAAVAYITNDYDNDSIWFHGKRWPCLLRLFGLHRQPQCDYTCSGIILMYGIFGNFASNCRPREREKIRERH